MIFHSHGNLCPGCFIGHGRSDAVAIKNAIRVAKEAAEANVLESLKTTIEESLNH